MQEFEDPQAQPLRTDNIMSKRKKDNHWYTKYYTENYHPSPSPTARFFSEETKIRFGIKKSVICLNIFIICFSLRNAGPDWWYFGIFHVNLFCFFKISPHNYFFSSEKNQPKSKMVVPLMSWICVSAASMQLRTN